MSFACKDILTLHLHQKGGREGGTRRCELLAHPVCLFLEADSPVLFHPSLSPAVEVRRLDIPAAEAYKDKGFSQWGIGPGTDLVFEIEVLKIEN